MRPNDLTSLTGLKKQNGRFMFEHVYIFESPNYKILGSEASLGWSRWDIPPGR